MLRYVEINLSKWSEFKELADHSRLEWIYRGQGKSEWKIGSSLERSEFYGPIERIDSIEHQLVEEFKRSFNNYSLGESTPTNLVEWLALIQHFGSPTRLVDFTRSPYVAAYFAFEEEYVDNKYVSVWIVDHVRFYQRAIYYLEKKGIPANYFKQQIKTEPYVFSDLLLQHLFDLQNLDCVIPLVPYSVNSRYLLQQSIFLAPCNIAKSFLDQLEFLGEAGHEAVLKINLPARLRNEVLRDLDKMNINRASLFPGLDGFAKTVNLRYSTLSTVDDEINALKFLRSKGYLETL